jgi:hypothetical protein
MANCPQINNTTIIGTSAVTYDGTPLPCTGVNACDDLNTILTKFDNVICSVVDSVNTLTEEVINITEDLMIIIDDVENIQNQLFICCPICDFTVTATELPVCGFGATAQQLPVCNFTGETHQVPDPTTTTTSSSTSTSTSTTSTSTSTTTSTTTGPPPAYYSYNVSLPGRESSGLACAETTFELTVYSDLYPLDFGHTVYTNTGLTALFVGGNLWYLWGIEGTAYQIGNDGVITAFFNCP